MNVAPGFEESLGRIVARWVDGARRAALWVLLGSLALAAGSVFYAGRNLGINADIHSLISSDLPHTKCVVTSRRRYRWKQIAPDERFGVMLGVIDQSFHFDTNRVANDPFRNFLSFALMNDLSIPWPLYGGLGAIMSWKPTDELLLLFGAGDSSSDEPWAFWETLDEGAWYQLAEARLTLDIPRLGKGHYRVTPWHNHIDGEDGWGVGVNIDQELGWSWLVGFFRFGGGAERVTSVERFVSGGLGIDAPFSRDGDFFGIGAARSRPSGSGRDETVIELFYRLQMTKTLELTPDLQFVFDPTGNPGTDFVFVPGVRLTLVF